jgi:hypothetical protein
MAVAVMAVVATAANETAAAAVAVTVATAALNDKIIGTSVEMNFYKFLKKAMLKRSFLLYYYYFLKKSKKITIYNKNLVPLPRFTA